MKDVYIETSIVSYLTSRPSRDVRVAAWQQITWQWWEQEKERYNLYTSELVIAEASAGDKEAAKSRLNCLRNIPELTVDKEIIQLASRFIENEVLPQNAQADALHIAIAAGHGMDFLLTWNCRHIDNAEIKPGIRSVCVVAGYTCPEICTPMELLSEQLK